MRTTGRAQAIDRRPPAQIAGSLGEELQVVVVSTPELRYEGATGARLEAQHGLFGRAQAVQAHLYRRRRGGPPAQTKATEMFRTPGGFMPP